MNSYESYGHLLLNFSSYWRSRQVLNCLDGIDSPAVNSARGWNAFVTGKKTNAASGKTSIAFLDQYFGQRVIFLLGPSPGKKPSYRPRLNCLCFFLASLDCPRRCAQFFDSATGSGAELDNLDAVMGKAKVLEGKRQWVQALDALNKVIVTHDWFLPALIEKAKALMMTADWDQALEAAGRLQQHEANNIEALRLNVLFLLSRESRCEEAAERLQELVTALQHLEPRNHDLTLSCAQLFSRLAGRHKAILNITFNMIKKVTDALPEKAKYLTELGYQYMMQGELSKAEQTFHSAVAKDETDVRALFGIINCRVQEGSLDDAEEQLEFLSEIQISVGKSPDLAFLQSLIAWRKRRDAEGALNLLNETLTLHITNFKSAVGYDFFIKLNADFMLEIAREYLQHTISGGTDDAAKPGGYLLRGVQVLETLTRFVPGLVPAQVRENSLLKLFPI